MANCKLRIGYLYPDIMSSYGDRGNIASIMRRCGWRGIVTEILELRLGDPVHPDDVDIFVIGNGGESQQRLIARDLADVKGMAIREGVDEGAALLAVGAGFELLGRFYQPSRGVELPGVGLFDAWAIQRGDDLGAASRTITEARADRAIGDLLVRSVGLGGTTPQDPPARPHLPPASPFPLHFSPSRPTSGRPSRLASASPTSDLLIGFENHSSRTYLGPTARPLGQVVIGQGNNGDGREGVRLGGAVGTYMRGPCLPRNPALADFLIRTALWRRYGEAELEPLADDLERAAHGTAVRRVTAAARAGNRPGLRRIGLKLAELAPRRGVEGGSSPLGQTLLAELAPRRGVDGGRPHSAPRGQMLYAHFAAAVWPLILPRDSRVR
jgi:lipid II isoglutaminyl synthase (glutamine-hydrolysing)